ncbi:MAG: 3'-5' exonuclease, partial [Sediminibacterium sp.]|nr:3'-5' exonuclease [Sediminibacterium sp.]
VEIAILKILPTGEKSNFVKRINPIISIPTEVTAVHGITDEMVANEPTFKDVALEILGFIDDADIGGYNSNKFDIPLLMEEFLRIGIQFDLSNRSFIDVQKIFHTMEQRTLGAAYKFYCNKNLEDAHSAAADINATFEILEAQINKYPQLGDTIEKINQVLGDEKMVDLARRFKIENNKIVFNFGKHKGISVEKILKDEPQYYSWMMRGDFPQDTKNKLTEIYNQLNNPKK